MSKRPIVVAFVLVVFLIGVVGMSGYFIYRELEESGFRMPVSAGKNQNNMNKMP